ncbi:hypothetical protein GCM10025771_17550 [Niveibacterium umoris]
MQAATFGELSVPTESYLGVYATPFFADSVSFSLTGLSTVYSDTKIYGGAGGYALFSGATMIGGLHTLGSAASFSGLTAGTYTFGYFGMGSGLSAVTLSANAVPAVPEPASYAMLLAGLGMVAGMARRRLS